MKSEMDVILEEETVRNEMIKDVDDQVPGTSTKKPFDLDEDKRSFRLLVQNLPKYFGYKELKKWFTKIGLNPTKIKPVMNKSRRGTANGCFLNFRSPSELPDAMRRICTNPFNGVVLTAKEANSAPEPFNRNNRQEHRKHKHLAGDHQAKSGETKRPPEAEILDIVTNLHHLSYPDQLIAKQNHAVDMLRKISKQFQSKAQGTLPWLKQAKGQLCTLEQVRPSPMPEKYRNKCEFSIGLSVNEERTIGFKLGKFKEGVVVVVSPDHCNHVNDTMKSIVKTFEQYVRSSEFEPLNEQTRIGYWHMLAVRTNSHGESMVNIHFHPQQLSEDTIEKEKERLRLFCGGLSGPGCPTFLYWVADRLGTGGQRRAQSMGEELVFGNPNADFMETLLGYNFKISPDAFFQVNTAGAEILYTVLLDVAQVTPNTVILDLCCGTGTIGIVMAKHVKRVFGVEIGAASIQDAKENAKRNGVENIEFICAKVEDVLDTILSTSIQPTEDVVVILDPPRSGVSNSVVESLRRFDRVRRLLYVACAADNDFTIANLYGLCKMKARNVGAGEVSFVPQQCIPVDLFPQTKNVELIFVFDRAESGVLKKTLMDVARDFDQQELVADQA